MSDFSLHLKSDFHSGAAHDLFRIADVVDLIVGPHGLDGQRLYQLAVRILHQLLHLRYGCVRLFQI